MLDTGSLRSWQDGTAGGVDFAGSANTAGSSGELAAGAGANEADGGNSGSPDGGSGNGDVGGTAGAQGTQGGDSAAAGAPVGGGSGGAGAAGANASGGTSGGGGHAGAPDTCVKNAAACPTGCVGFSWQAVGYIECSAPSSSWSSAEQHCQLLSMRLAQVESAAENSAILSHASGLGAWLWLGATDSLFGAKGSKLEWLDTTVIASNGVPASGVYQDFAAKQPATVTGSACVQMNVTGVSPAGSWSAASCNNSGGYVCEAYH